MHQKLRRLIGQNFRYLSCDWVLIDVLTDSDQVVLQRSGEDGRRQLQTDQYGHPCRHAPETLSLPISDKSDPDTYSEELLLLLRGKI